MKRSLTLVLVLLFAAIAAQAHAAVTSPRAFDDDYDAALAASGDTQWLIVGGVTHDRYGIKAYERSGTGTWHELPPLPGKHFNSSVGVHVAVQGTTVPYPCFLYPIDAGPKLECLRDGAWHDMIGTRFRKFNLQDLIAPTDSSLALIATKIVARDGHNVALTYVMRSNRAGPWTALAKPLEGVIVAQFERSDVPGSVRVGIERMHRNAAKRYIAAPSGGRLAPVTPTDDTPAGPFVGGPLTIAGTSYFPLVNAVTGPFTFGVLALAPEATAWSQIGGAPLSDPSAAGQGSVGVANDTPWAIWQEDTQRGHKFDGAIRIANLASPTPAPVTLWSGKRIGPGPVQVADIPGPEILALYPVGTAKGLRVVVESLTP